MGNCLGRASNSNFKGQSRTLGSSAGPPARPVAAGGQQQHQAPPSTTPAAAAAGGGVGGGGARRVGVPSGVTEDGSGGGNSPRSAAARAAQERAARERDAAQKGGRLAHNLAAQKAQTVEGTLRQDAETTRRQRDVDRGTEALTHN